MQDFGDRSDEFSELMASLPGLSSKSNSTPLKAPAFTATAWASPAATMKAKPKDDVSFDEDFLEKLAL